MEADYNILILQTIGFVFVIRGVKAQVPQVRNKTTIVGGVMFVFVY